jgi:hypothetical protein
MVSELESIMAVSVVSWQSIMEEQSCSLNGCQEAERKNRIRNQE